MTCPICKHGEIAPGHTTIAIQRAESTIILKGAGGGAVDRGRVPSDRIHSATGSEPRNRRPARPPRPWRCRGTQDCLRYSRPHIDRCGFQRIPTDRDT